MNAEDRALWDRVHSFSLDEPDAAFPFSRRLAEEHRWSADFTARAILEYKRFAFLAIVAGHPVSPSETVDEVWHAHLTYTRAYWEKFCPVLGRPLHHEPTRGGALESVKFHDWYAKTLASYRRCFDTEPPRDIWPATEVHARQIKIDPARFWLIPKPTAARLAPAAAILIAPFLVAGCASTLGFAWNPFDWRGPQFLIFFWSLAAATVLANVIIRWELRRPAQALTDTLPPLDPYAVALLAGNRRRAVEAALVRLVQTEVLTLESNRRRFKVARALPKGGFDFEQQVFAAIHASEGSTPEQVQKQVAPALEQMEAGLKEHGLLVSDGDVRKAQRWTGGLNLLLCGIGLAKIVIGSQRHRPVAFLVISSLIAVVYTAIMFAHRLYRSRHGDAFLASLRREHYALATRPLDGFTAMAAASLPLAVGLFGDRVLGQTEFSDLRRAFAPASAGDGSSSGCSSSGGGCGGGGGGGCGGCGGGGGD